MLATGGLAGEALRSGPQLGQRPLPFTSNAVTGPNRGKQHCYVCEMKDETAVLAFCRSLDEPTRILLGALRDAAKTYPREKYFGWLVVLGKERGTVTAAAEAALEAEALALARRAGATSVPLSALGDIDGPPGYNVAPDAMTTVLIFRSGKVLYNRAYKKNEWTPRAAREALKALPGLIEKRPAAGSPPAPAGA